MAFGVESVSGVAMKNPHCRPLPALVATLLAGPLWAEGPQMTSAVKEGFTTVNDVAANKTAPDTKPDLLVVPIPQSSPALGTGVTVGGAMFYNPNGSKEPWTTGGAVMATSNGSWALGAGHKMFWGKDKFKLTAFVGYGDANLRFHGIGPLAGELNQSVDINDSSFFAFVDPQVRVAPSCYLCVRALYLDIKIRLRRDQEVPPEIELPDRDLETRLVQMGPVAVYDSRDNSLYPRNGVYAQASLLMGLTGLGSDFDNERFTAYANVYKSLSPNTVFAARVSTCAVTSGAPMVNEMMNPRDGVENTGVSEA